MKSDDVVPPPSDEGTTNTMTSTASDQHRDEAPAPTSWDDEPTTRDDAATVPRKISSSGSVHFLVPPSPTFPPSQNNDSISIPPTRKISTVSPPFPPFESASDDPALGVPRGRVSSTNKRAPPFLLPASPEEDADELALPPPEGVIPPRKGSRRPSSRPRQQSFAGPQPPDGGWGWMVVFAAFVSCAGVVGLTRAFGIIYVEILHAFPESSALAASWIPGLYNTLSTGLAPVAGALSNRYSCRSVVFVGGLLMSCGLVLNFFASSVEYLYVSFGVITGCGAGMCTTPGIIMVARYFKKRRALANGLCLAGTSSGAFVQPLIVEYLTNKFGFRGCCLIMGALMLHISAFSLVYRPLEAPKPRPAPSSSSTRRLPRKNETGCAKKYCWLLNCLLNRNSCLPTKKRKPGVAEGGAANDSEATKRMLPATVDGATIIPAGVVAVGALSRPSSPPIHISCEDTPDGEYEEYGDGDNDERYDEEDDDEISNTSQLMKTKNLCLDHSINDLHTVSAAQFQDSIRRRQSLVQPGRRPSHHATRRPPEPTGLRRYLDLSLFKNKAFVLFVVSSAFTSVGYPHASVFMPAYATINLGIPKKETGLLLSITAGADLVGRIGFGWLADQNLFKRIHGYMFNVAMTAAATMTIPAATTYPGLIANSAVYGLGVGSFFMLTPVILTDHHGAEKVASSYGLVRLFHGVASIVTPPIVGVIRDATGQYTGGFILMGCIMMVGSLIMFFMPAALRYEERKERRRKSTVSNISVNNNRSASVVSWGGDAGDRQTGNSRRENV